METLTTNGVDLLDLTDKNSSEWNLSSEESDTEEVATQRGNGYGQGGGWEVVT